jgi:hypothetical protein
METTIYDRILFQPYIAGQNNTDITKAIFFKNCIDQTSLHFKKQIHSDQTQFILSNGANSSISKNGSGTTYAIRQINENFFNKPNKIETCDHRQHIINKHSKEDQDNFKSKIKNSEYLIMCPYYVELTTMYQGYKIIGVNHIISIDEAKDFQLTDIYKDIFIHNIKVMIKNANTKVENTKEVCSSPGSMYEGYMWLNTYYTLLAIDQLNEKIQVNNNLFIVIDGSLSDIKIAKERIKQYKNKQKFIRNNPINKCENKFYDKSIILESLYDSNSQIHTQPKNQTEQINLNDQETIKNANKHNNQKEQEYFNKYNSLKKSNHKTQNSFIYSLSIIIIFLITKIISNTRIAQYI